MKFVTDTVGISPDNQEILIPHFLHTQKDNYSCQASIIFDNLWKHLISEAQKKTKYKLIFSLITFHLLSMLQPTSMWNFIIQSKNCISVSSPRYAILTTSIFLVQVQSQAHNCDLSTLGAQIKAEMESLNNSNPLWIIWSLQEMLLK